MSYISDLPRQVSRIPDAELQLRDYSTAAISATTNGTAVAFNPRGGDFKVVYIIAAHTDYEAGVKTWDVKVEVDSSSSFGSPTVVPGTAYTSVGTAINFEIAVSGDRISQLEPAATHIRVVATKTSTPGAFTYGAFLVC